MANRIAINGFGRIGRYLTRIMADDSNVEIVAINARADNDTLAHLLKYDSVHGRFPGTVEAWEDGIVVNGRKIRVTRYPLGEWKWDEVGVDVVVETTGKVTTRDDLAVHMKAGAKKVVLSAPGKEMDLTVVMGVNDHLYDPAKHDIVSNASCTTNCLAPAAKVVHENFGIEHGLMTTVHAYTMGQRILDGSHKDLRRGRAGAANMVPTTTGAAKAVGLVIPELAGKLDGMAVRVPTPNVSLVDLTVTMSRAATADEVNAALKAASENGLKDNMGYCDEPLVSTDYVGSTFGGVVDAMTTNVIGDRMLKLIVWYDNEAGFTNQLRRLIHKVAASI